jgi:TRAP-type C4-dicarboxylate transport system substrate-binding protein
MNLLRQETMNILNNYQTLTPKWLLDHFITNNNDSDCVFIYKNLPENIRNEIDEAAVAILKENEQQFKKNEQQFKKNEQLSKIIKSLTDQANAELDMYRDLNRQLDECLNKQ